jgi:hypothetical protein
MPDAPPTTAAVFPSICISVSFVRARSPRNLSGAW